MTQNSDLDFQNCILPGVSRTFALTIPQLPEQIQDVVANAYLLCRITDTIEDTTNLDLAEKAEFHQQFIDVVYGRKEAGQLIESLVPRLEGHPHPLEVELVKNTDTVIRIMSGFNQRQQSALKRCIEIMGHGMAEYERRCSQDGLPDIPALDHYCYVVAGVVGEMLTELFCDYSPQIDNHRERLQALSVSFGEGLQMTNILKDIHDDWERGVCWLPADHFSQFGCEIYQLPEQLLVEGYSQAIISLVDKATGHLQDALQYTLLIPAKEKGIRRFCLWAIGMALLTLRNIRRQPTFTSGDEVKISRSAVKTTILVTNMTTSSDSMLKWLFRRLAG